MKRIIFVLLAMSIVVCSGNSLLARSSKFGLKGGFNFSSLSGDVSALYKGDRIIALNERYTGYHLGVVGSFVYPGFFFQPELLLVGTGRDMLIDFANESLPDEYFLQRFQHLSLPLILGMKIGALKLGAGPVFSMFLGQNNNAMTYKDIRPDLSKTTLGYQLGAGLQIGGILLEARYESNLTQYGEGIQIGSQFLEFDMRPRQIILSIGLLF